DTDTQAGKDIGRCRGQHYLPEIFETVKTNHPRHIAIIFRDISHPHGRVDDDGPDRRYKDNEDGRGMAVLKTREGKRQPSQRWHCAQHLENRIKHTKRLVRLSDQHSLPDSHHLSYEITVSDTYKTSENLPGHADIVAPNVVKKINNQLPALLKHGGSRRKRSIR